MLRASRPTLWQIARREALDHLSSLRFYVIVATMAVLVGVSTFVMYRDYSLRMANHAVLRERARPRPGESGVMAVVEPRPLSVFAKGLDEVMGRGYTVTAYMGIDVHDRQTQRESLFSLVPPPDLLYVVKTLVSLVALLFAFDAMSGEKERGTLKLTLSFAVSRGQLVAGKLAAGLAAVLAPLGVAWLAALLVLSLQPDLVLGPAELARVALMAGATALYATFFFAVGLLISALAKRSSQALVVSLFVWATVVFALPNVGNLVAEQMSPVSSAQSQEFARMQAFAKNRFIAIQHGRSDPAGTVGAFNREYDRAVEDQRVRLDRLAATSRAIGRATPAAALSHIFTEVAGTGLSDQRRLSRALMEFKSRNLKALELQNERGAPPLSVFEFPPVPLGEVLRDGAVVDLVWLGGLTALVLAGAFLAAMRTDPR